MKPVLCAYHYSDEFKTLFLQTAVFGITRFCQIILSFETGNFFLLWFCPKAFGLNQHLKLRFCHISFLNQKVKGLVVISPMTIVKCIFIAYWIGLVCDI